MKILHVVRGLNNSSGTTHIVVPLAEAQAELGHSVSVVCVAKPGEQAVRPQNPDVDFIEFPMTVSSQHFGFSIPFVKHLLRTISGYDVIHVHAVWNFVTFLTMLTALRSGVPCIVAPQGSLDRVAWEMGSLPRKVYARLFELPLLEKINLIQALTDAEATQIRDFGIKTPLEVIPNGIDIKAFKPCDSDSVSLPDDFPRTGRVILFLGRLHPKKGLDELIKAFAIVSKAVADVSLVIAGGDGGSGYAADVQRWVNDAGIAGRVVLLGEVSGAVKLGVLQSAHMFVLPSRSEGLPIAVLESMACGLPVIITKACNLPEVEEMKAGIIYDENEGSFAAAIMELLSDEGLRDEMRQNARSLAVDRFDWRHIAEKCVAVYQGVIRN